MTTMSGSQERLAEIRERITAAAAVSGRSSESVRLVGVSKSAPADEVGRFLDSGLLDFGENRTQELLEKQVALGPRSLEIKWHFIGRLQRNKVRQIAGRVHLYQSVDRESLAATIASADPGARVLLQLRLGDESAKGGVDQQSLPALLDRTLALGLVVEGLMGIPPAHLPPEPFFDQLVSTQQRFGLAHASIGMSGDYETAIRSGATIVRVGTALFGSRT